MRRTQPRKKMGGESFVTCTLQGLKPPPHPTAGMRPRLACVRAGKTESAPGLTSIKRELPGVGRAEVWRGREGQKDPPLTDTPPLIGLKESPHSIWRRARERGGARHALPPPQRLIGPRSLCVRFGKVGSAGRCKAVAEDWLLRSSEHFLRGTVAAIQVAPARLRAAICPPRAAKATR